MLTRTMIVAVAVMLLVAGAARAVDIETVHVGNPGNAADSTGYGAVSYEYNIGKYEVTAGQYAAFLNAVAKTDTYSLYNSTMSNTSYGSGITRSGPSGNFSYTVDPNFTNRPVNWVSFWDSCRFANWLQNGQPTGDQGPGTTETGTYTLGGYMGYDGGTMQRDTNSTWAVTSEDEWYKAAYYKGGSTSAGYWLYPTRSETAPGQDMNDVSGNNANYYTAPYAYPIDAGKNTTLVGEFQNSPSPYGTFDQGGNVREWNDAVLYQGSNYSFRGLRGGSFTALGDVDYALQAPCRIYFEYYPSDEIHTIGFRVSEVPEPASMAVLALGSIGMLIRRRGLRR